jgi:hypothetical protein
MGITVYDWEGNERNLTYLRSKYGQFLIKPAAPGPGSFYQISTLRERIDAAATLVVRIVDEDGVLLESVQVAWYWPDAPPDNHAGPVGGVLPQMEPNRCVHGTTHAGGEVGFAMGSGAFYWPEEGQIGPHATWIYGAETRSELILGLGMLAGTSHHHFDVEFTLVEEDEPAEPPEVPVEEIRAELDRMEAAIQAIRRLLP